MSYPTEKTLKSAGRPSRRGIGLSGGNTAFMEPSGFHEAALHVIAGERDRI